MAQAVNLPAVVTTSPGEALTAPQNNAENQGGAELFPGLLALSAGAKGALAGATASASVDPQGGQELPPETLADSNSGETLPQFAEQADAALVTSVVAGIKTGLSHTSPDADESPEEVLVTTSPGADKAPEAAILLPAQPIDSTIQPAAKPVLSGDAVTQDITLANQSLRDPSAIHTTRHHQSPAVQVQHTNPADALEVPVQSIRSTTEEVIKPVIRAADIETVVQNFRRMVAPVPGSETRSSHDISSLLAAVQSTPATPIHNNSQQLPGLMLDTPFQKAGWDQGLTEKIQWMVGQRLQGAEIKLNPAHLGPVEVKIQMHNDQATVHFTATHGVVRDALEAAVPRLREMFDNQGIQLADVDVSEQSFTQQHKDREAGTAQHAARLLESDSQQSHEDSSGGRWTTPVSAVGTLDLFA